MLAVGEPALAISRRASGFLDPALAVRAVLAGRGERAAKRAHLLGERLST